MLSSGLGPVSKLTHSVGPFPFRIDYKFDRSKGASIKNIRTLGREGVNNNADRGEGFSCRWTFFSLLSL